MRVRGAGSEGTRRGLGPFTGGQLTLIIVVLALVIGLPVGAFAVTSVNDVSIVDGTGAKRAAVDSNGQLLTRQSGYPQGAFSLTGLSSNSSFKLSLPSCATSACRVSITDMVFSNINSDSARLTVTVEAKRPGNDGTCNNPGSNLKNVLSYHVVPINSTVVIDLSTAIVITSTTGACLVFLTSSPNNLLFGYTISGFRQTY